MRGKELERGGGEREGEGEGGETRRKGGLNGRRVFVQWVCIIMYHIMYIIRAQAG